MSKPFPATGICQHTRSLPPTQTVLKNGQPESTISDGKSTEWPQLEMFSLELENSNKKTRNAQVL